MGVESIVSDEVGAYDEYEVRYFEDSDDSGKLDAGDARVGGTTDWGKVAPVEVGSYFAVAIYPGGERLLDNTGITQDFLDEAGYIAKYFKVAPRSLEGAVAVEGTNPADTTFTYNGAKQNISFALDGQIIDPADYTVQFLDAAGADVTATGVENAGDYTAIVTGKPEKGYANVQVRIPFKVDVLNLDDAAVYAQVQDSDDTAIAIVDAVTFNGTVKLSAIAADVSTPVQTAYQCNGNTLAQGQSGYAAYNESGKNVRGGYTFEVTGKDGNVTGKATFKLDVVSHLVPAANFFYGDDQFNTALTGPFYATDWAFDADEVSVTDNAGKAYDKSAYVVSVADENGVPAEVSAAGDYTASVTMTIPSDYSVGGSVQATFTYFAGKLDGQVTDIVVLLDGKNVEPGAATPGETVYDAEAVVPAVTVKCGEKVLAQGSDYSIEYKNADNEVVDQILDAGTYTMEVKSDSYDVDNGVFYITVKQLEPEYVTVDSPYSDPEILAWTGEQVTPTFVAYDKDGKAYILAADDVDQVAYQDVDANFAGIDAKDVVDEGEYKAFVDLTGNFTGTKDCKFTVAKTVHFPDVAVDTWYGPAVQSAVDHNGYMAGVSNGLFAPEQDMTRAEFAQVLYNMAGKDATNSDDTFPTQFGDLDADAWYAQAVSWAVSNGVVYGTSDDTFEPSAKITREQIATMLHRYAELASMDLTVEDPDALGQFSDADAVSAWAVDALTWAADKGFVSGKGDGTVAPQDYATRAEIASMAVRVQPDALV